MKKEDDLKIASFLRPVSRQYEHTNAEELYSPLPLERKKINCGETYPKQDQRSRETWAEK
jgi:hypothetical protein